MTDKNTALWDSVCTTPPSETKPITGKAYSGTSPDPYYMVRRATEVFGPCGIGWGFNIISERIETYETERLSIVHLRVWYILDGKRGEVEHWGGTPFAGVRASGKTFMDEDAVKKSVTDALTKALSMLGFAGDIFSGLYDDSKYVHGLKEEERKATKPAPKGEVTIPTPKELHPDAKVNAATGEIEPYRIEVDLGKVNGRDVWIAYGQKLLGGASTATSETVLDEWLGINTAASLHMSKEEPKAHKRMIEAVGRIRLKLRTAPEAEKKEAPKPVQVAPNAKDRAHQLAENPTADRETGEVNDARLLPKADSEAAMKGLMKNLARVGTAEAFKLWKDRAGPAIEVMHREHINKLNEAIAAKEAELAEGGGGEG